MKRKPILMGKMKRMNNRTNKTITIGIVGVSKGVGVTHTSLLIAGYLNQLKLKTALVELNNRKAFRAIEKAYEGFRYEEKLNHEFYIKGVHYYKYQEGLDLLKILSQQYQYVVMDIGYNNQSFFSEFLRADIAIIVGHAIEWKRDEIIRFHEEHQQMPSSSRWLYCVPFSSKQDIKELKKVLKESVYPIPYHQDPFIGQGDTSLILSNILNS